MVKVCEVCVKEFQTRHRTSRFCSRECQNQWQRSIPWEQRVSSEVADQIRKQVSIRVSGDGNPSKNPDVSRKISTSLKAHLENVDRTGENNPFYGKHHTETLKQKQSELKAGKRSYDSAQFFLQNQNVLKMQNHPNWQGGISFLPYSVDFTKQLKEAVKSRDMFKCVVCSSPKKPSNLCVHHIDYDKQNASESNLVSLCWSCHGKTNYNRDSWIAFFKKQKEITQCHVQ